MAIARFIRSTNDPHAAEAAIAVADDWQQKGLGTLLLLRLVAAAVERGIERFTGQALTSNAAIRDVLSQLHAGVRVTSEGDELNVEVDLPEVPSDADSPAAPLRRLLELVARGLVVVRRAMERLS